MGDMNDILNPAEEVEEVVEEAPQEDQPTGEVKTQVAAEVKEEPKATDTAEQVRAELAALTKERQRLREKEAALEQERQSFLQQRQPEEKPDFWENPEAVLTAAEQRIQAQMLHQKIEMCEEIVRDLHPDYDEKLNVFLELVKSEPDLTQKMARAANPAKFAYTTAEKHLKMQELQKIGDPQQYRAQVEAELKASIRAELEAEYAEKIEAEKRAAIEAKLGRGGFARERSAAPGSTTKNYTGPTPLGSILK